MSALISIQLLIRTPIHKWPSGIKSGRPLFVQIIDVRIARKQGSLSFGVSELFSPYGKICVEITVND